MSDSIYIVLAFVAAYLIGSVPSAVWVGRLLYGTDVRDFGSGNAGATNTFRVLGRSAGAIVMLLDILKGMAAAALANILFDADLIATVHPEHLTLYQIMLGITAIVGHVFPVFAQFRGGKGVATMVGMILTINLEVALACIGIFLVVLLASKYVSLGSIIASLTFPLLLLLPPFHHDADTITVLVAFSLFVIVVLTHHENIRRILSGNERKTLLVKRKG